MTIQDLLHILCKDEAQKALLDISLIDKSISTTPSEEYIQTFIDKFKENTYMGYNSIHFVITNEPGLFLNSLTQAGLEQSIETGFWVYRTNGGSNEDEPTVCHKFIYFGDKPNAYQKAKRQLKKYQESRLYNWIALIDTVSEKVTMWVRQGNTRTWKKQRSLK